VCMHTQSNITNIIFSIVRLLCWTFRKSGMFHNLYCLLKYIILIKVPTLTRVWPPTLIDSHALSSTLSWFGI
jgi:hypothetical protein